MAPILQKCSFSNPPHWGGSELRHAPSGLRRVERNEPMGTLKSLTSVFACVVWIVGAAQAQQAALRFIPLAPCRIADTRNAAGPFGGPTISGHSSRDFVIPNSPCLAGVPATVAAYSLNVTAVPAAGFLGYLTIWPTGQPLPFVATLNSYDGRYKSNAAIVPAGAGGAISIYVTDISDVVLDINGVFMPASDPSAPLAFFPLTPCRVADTRNPSGPLGGPTLAAKQTRSFPVLSSPCNIPPTAQAYSFNFSAVPPGPLGYLTTWPTSMSLPNVATLLAPTGTVTANAAIVPAGNNGAIDVYVKDATDLVIDINGYFAPSTSGTDLSLYTVVPCRIVDTRETTGPFLGQTREDMTASPCGIPPSAQAVVLNATVVPSLGFLGFLSLWPDGQTQPYVSTLNAYDGLVTNNMAIVPTSSSGVIDAYATDPTQLIFDTSGYFAAGKAPAPTMYLLSVAKSGTGAGTVTSLDGKITCGLGPCAVSYVSGTTVTLTASADSRSSFGGWSGGGCSGTGNCTVSLTAAANVTATFNGPSISLNSASVGANLETLAAGSLSVAAPSGTTLTVTTTSSDPSKVLLEPFAIDPSGTSAGTPSFTGTVAAGSIVTPGFWIQALASSGTAQITVSAPGYQSAVATVTLTPSGFQLSGPAGTGTDFTATLGGANTPLTVSVAQLDASGNVLATNQALRGGVTASVTVNSGTQATGTIAGSPVTVQPGTTSGTVTFQPKALGTSLLSITQPAGFSASATGTQLTATVIPPAITLNSTTVGFNLQTLGVGQLSLAPSSALSVTINSAPAGLVLLSTSPTAAGASSINVQVAAGTTLMQFYIQGLASSGQVTLTASAPGYSGAAGQVTLMPSAFLLSESGVPNSFGVDFATTTISPPTGLTVTVYQLSSSLQPLTAGQLRPGISQLSVAVASGTTSTGTIQGSPAVFNGGDSSNTTLSFQPLNCNSTPCTTVLSVTQPSGFSPPASGGQLTVTVDKPAVSPRMNPTTIGSNLEVGATGALDASVPSDLTVTISSSDKTKVLLSTSPTGAGSQSIQVTVPAGNGVNSFGFPTYYVYALAKSGTVTLTASAPAPFRSGTITVTLAPAGFVISGVNGGVGQDVGARVGDNVSLTVSAYVLDPTTLAPTQLAEALRDNLSASVNVTSNSPAGVISGSPVVITGGNASGTVTLHAASSGTATVTAAKPSTPTGFDKPASSCGADGKQPCNQLRVIIQ
jgi:hypothetical protein